MWIVKRFVVIFLGLWFLASCSGNQKPVYQQDNLGASSLPLELSQEEFSNGFLPDEDGWSFRNYSPDRSSGFSIGDAIVLFGEDLVCEELDGPCIPTPAAAEWLDFIQTASQGGVCEGMTAYSFSRFLLDSSPITGELPLTTEVEQKLAQLFATQFLPEVVEKTKPWQNSSIQQIVEELQTALSDPSHEQYTLGIYSEDSGHSLLPYKVLVDSTGQGSISVYDPNWPGQERYVNFDTNSDTWSYAYFGANQELDRQKWSGDGSSIDLTPLSSREPPFTTPYST